MLNIKPRKNFKTVFKAPFGLPRQTENKVAAYIVKARIARKLYRLNRLRRGMYTPRSAQLTVVKRLHTQRQAVYTCALHGAQKLPVTAFGICLNCYLSIFFDFKISVYSVKKPVNQLWRQHTGCAAAYIYGVCSAIRN